MQDIKFKLNKVPDFNQQGRELVKDNKNQYSRFHQRNILFVFFKKNKLIITLILTVAILSGLFSGFCFKKAYQKSLLAKNELSELYSDFSQNNNLSDILKIEKKLYLTKENLSIAYLSLRRIKYLKSLPFIGEGINTGDNLIQVGFYTVFGGYRLVKIATPFNVFLRSNLKENQPIENILSIKNALEGFLQVEQYTRGASDDFNKAILAMDNLPFWVKRYLLKDWTNKFYQYVPELKSYLDDFSVIIKNLPTLLGLDRKKTYILFFLNNNEIRPIGGFPGSLSVLEVIDARLPNFKIENIYKFQAEKNVDFNSLSNYTVDIPTFSQKIIKQFEKSGHFDNIDGIILVDTEILKELLKVTGPITVRNEDYDYDYILNDSNVIDIIERHTKKTWYAIGEPRLERKEILNLLMEEIIKKLPDLKEQDFLKLAKGLKRLIKEKHLIFYFKDNELQNLMERENFAGKVENNDGDYCLVSDDNFAWTKSHQALKKKFIYKLNLENGEAELLLNYYLSEEQNWKIKDIISLTKVYLPPETTIVNFEGFTPDPPLLERYDDLNRLAKLTEFERDNKTVFSGWIYLKPLESKDFKLFYKLPKDVYQRKTYELLFQKQPGIIHNDLKIEINLGKRRPKKIDPLPYLYDGKIIKWQTNLLQDRKFMIYF